MSENTVGKVRRLAEDIEALRAEEAEEKKVLTTMLNRVTTMLKRVTAMLKRVTMMLKRVTTMLKREMMMLTDLLSLAIRRERSESLGLPEKRSRGKKSQHPPFQ